MNTLSSEAPSIMIVFMIIGIGVDVIEIGRIQKSIERIGERFLYRVFTSEEIDYCERRKNRFQHYAGRFAAKEAAFKALGSGWSGGIAWKDAEIRVETSGKPTLVLSGRAKVLAEKQGVTLAYVSIAHAGTYAVAQVVLSN